LESCTCGYDLYENGLESSLSYLKARSFALPGDQPHYAPDRPADVRHVRLEIALDFELEMVSGTVYTTFSSLYEELKTLTLDAVDLHIEQVSLPDGTCLKYSADGKKLDITLDHTRNYGEEFTIAVRYSAKPRTGLHFVKPAPEDPIRPVQAWTIAQPRYASFWFPCLDSPNERATTEMIVTVPAHFQAISNGNLLAVTENEAGDASGGMPTKTWHWRHDVPHAAYLVSLVVGEFAVIEDSYKGKPVTYYVRPDRKDDAPLYMGKTPEMMRFFSEYTGVEYPYDKYAQTVVELFTGAMEHTTATTHSFSLLMDKRAALDFDMVSVTAHELAHQWFGDLVTCRDWANGWLNEGFASYIEHLWTEQDRGTDYFKQSMHNIKQRYIGEDRHYRRPIVYYVYHDQGFELFDRHMYDKGAWVLHMLRHQLGDAAFRRAIHTYLERYREREVVTADFQRTLEEVTGRSLEQFFQQWIYQGGYPEFEVSYAWDGEHSMAKVKIRQAQKVDELTPCFVTPVDLAFTLPTTDEASSDEDTVQTRTVQMRVVVGEDGQIEQSFYIPLEREPLMVRFDPDGWLLKSLKFERPTRMTRYQLAHDPDVLGRIEAARALGKEGGDENMRALATALLNAPFWGVRSAAVRALGELRTEAAQAVLLQALQQLDPIQFSRTRAAIATALGQFQAPEQEDLAGRSAQALSALLEQGDISYLVESAAAEALGKTRTPGNIELLERLLQRPTWNATLERGALAGLALTGEDHIVEIVSSWLTDTHRHPTQRLAAAFALETLGKNRYLYSEAACQRAITTLCHAVEHDSWQRVRAVSALALMPFGDKRAIASLERAVGREVESRAERNMRSAISALHSGGNSHEQLKDLRQDLDRLREENRKLQAQLSALEARAS
jgi:aminopeptidase N